MAEAGEVKIKFTADTSELDEALDYILARAEAIRDALEPILQAKPRRRRFSRAERSAGVV